ncbi:MAG: hypothetical protein P4L57_07820 [Rhizomicrobium sp.]|nr:hypothetical protein [Rhizomicrobium sp.]
MVRTFSHIFALLLSIALVGGAGWSLSRPYMNDVLGPFGPVIDCMCIPLRIAYTDGWKQLDARSFWVLAPEGTALRRDSNISGAILHQRFTLTYNIADRGDDDRFARSGRDYSQETVWLNGREGEARWATFPGRSEPYLLQFIVPRAVRAPGGRWLVLELQGWFGTEERRELALRILKTVDLSPSLAQNATPPRPSAPPPTFDIAPPPS